MQKHVNDWFGWIVHSLGPPRLLYSSFFFFLPPPFFFFYLLNQGNVLKVVTVLTLHNIEAPAPGLDPFAACA